MHHAREFTGINTGIKTDTPTVPHFALLTLLFCLSCSKTAIGFPYTYPLDSDLFDG